MKAPRYLKNVRAQYELYPYPSRNPEDERHRLVRTWLGSLDAINHFCFMGKRNFSQGFRALVAGGGTGDATIYLAEQLKNTDSEVVHLDFSEASMSIAKERARIRGLRNITWVNDSILELPRLSIGLFDYINCVGVLHHLEDPKMGLASLKSVLSPGGAAGIMVYGKYGREGVYQMQKIMRLVNQSVTSAKDKIILTRAMLKSLPAGRLTQDLKSWETEYNGGDAAVYDLFLHEQDQAFTVEGIYDLVEGQGLNIIDFVGLRTFGDAFYRPETFIRDPELLARIKTLSMKKQQEVAELIGGCIGVHSFFAAERSDVKCDPGDLSLVPIINGILDGKTSYFKLNSIAKSSHPGETITLFKDEDSSISLAMTPAKMAFLGLIDGHRTTGQILEMTLASAKARHGPDHHTSLDDLVREIVPMMENLINAMFLYLRDPRHD